MVCSVCVCSENIGQDKVMFQEKWQLALGTWSNRRLVQFVFLKGGTEEKGKRIGNSCTEHFSRTAGFHYLFAGQCFQIAMVQKVFLHFRHFPCHTVNKKYLKFKKRGPDKRRIKCYLPKFYKFLKISNILGFKLPTIFSNSVKYFSNFNRHLLLAQEKF